MKKVQYILLVSIVALVAASCNKDFLNRIPQTDITPEAFFNNPADLQTYTNGFYSQISASYSDIGTDNISTYIAGGEVRNLLNGTLSAATVGATGWNDWGNLRSINNMLDKVGGVTGDPIAINHYTGIARFFRAMFYFNKIRRYSDVPWYSHALADVDSALYKPADPRSMVADSVLKDLEFAVENILETEGDRTRITKWSALALMSRFCLYEGTYRKYHPEVNLQSDHIRFLEKAVAAAEEIINSKRFSITGTGAEGYRALFSSPTLNGNREMILWQASNKELGVANNSHTVFNYQWGLSRSLQESFLMKDGTLFTAQPDYNKKDFIQVFANRDPRMAETIAYPGFSNVADPARPFIYLLTLGGYDQLKFYPRDPALRGGWVLNYTSLPIYRYAEVLLNYAEAKAELGTITQAELDMSVNLLRRRVEMPDMQLALANNMIDPILAAYYANVAGVNKGIILELRRERRVETACEGLRFDDLQRWYAGKRIEDAQQGMYITQLGAFDVTGDGRSDVALLPSPTDTSAIANLPADVRASLARYYLKDNSGANTTIYLTNGTSGHIAFASDVNSKNFIEPKYYYRPIPLQQTVLNPNLKQPFGW